MNQQQKYAEVEAEFAQMGAAADDDVEFMAQRASAARGTGNMNKALEILNRAIRKFPDEPMPYLRRARILMLDPATLKDATADMATAIKLRPSFWQALRTRAMVSMGQGRTDDGLRDLRDATDRNPGLDDLRLEVITYLVRF